MSKATPQIVIPTLAGKLQEQSDAEVAAFKPLVSAGKVDAVGHAPLAPEEAATKHVSELLYMFPESYNALRRELVANWPNLWAFTGYNMAFNAGQFVHDMNDALGMKIQYDTQKVDATCTAFLNELRKHRGLSPL
jgi:hypothetical protein